MVKLLAACVIADPAEVGYPSTKWENDVVACANEAFFDAKSRAEAAKGIIDPVRRDISARTLIYRYSDTPDHATYGFWWFDQDQHELVRSWAASKQLTMAHAARILSATAHEWNSMTVLIRAVVNRPLVAYQGLSRQQSVPGNNTKMPSETLSPPASFDGKPINQLYIPGFKDKKLVDSCISCGAPVSIEIGASHIFGVPGVPPGTVMN